MYSRNWQLVSNERLSVDGDTPHPTRSRRKSGKQEGLLRGKEIRLTTQLACESVRPEALRSQVRAFIFRSTIVRMTVFVSFVQCILRLLLFPSGFL